MSAPDICGKNTKPLQLISTRLPLVSIAMVSDRAAETGQGFDETLNELVLIALMYLDEKKG